MKEHISPWRAWFVASILILHFLIALPVRAADGSGTITVTPTSVTAGSKGNTLTFTYTAAETLRDGSVEITLPNDWSKPQESKGTVGYTKISTTGTTAKRENALDSTSGWQTTSNLITLSSDSSTKKQGQNSLKGVLTAGVGSERIFYNYSSSQNWSSYTKFGFWIRSSRSFALGNAQLWLSESSNVPDDTTTVKYNLPSISNDAWTYITIDLTSKSSNTRDAVISYGFSIPVDIGATYYFDQISLGPNNTPTFSGNTIAVPILELAQDKTITITYGAEGGLNGGTAPTTTRQDTIQVTQKGDSAGTLSQLSKQPTITITAAEPSKLQFQTSPSQTSAGVAIPSFQIVVKDPYGNTVASDDTTEVTVSVTDKASTATLNGNLKSVVVDGVATFQDLSIDKPGDYSLTAKAAGLIDGISKTFTITGKTSDGGGGGGGGSGGGGGGGGTPSTAAESLSEELEEEIEKEAGEKKSSSEISESSLGTPAAIASSLIEEMKSEAKEISQLISSAERAIGERESENVRKQIQRKTGFLFMKLEELQEQVMRYILSANVGS